MNLVQNMDVENKKVILRCDLNVTIKEGKILSDEKIEASLETINYLLSKKAKVIIMSHLGRVKTEEDKTDNTLLPVYERLNELLNNQLTFCEMFKGLILEEAINELKPGEALLIENTRFADLDGKKESSCDPELAKYWASLGDLFVKDDFGLSHRKHASNSGIAKYLPMALGFLMQKEINGLAPLIKPESPFVVLMGGAKVTDKIELITNILKKCDYLLVGGGIANTFLAINHEIGLSLISPECLNEVAALLDLHPGKIILPVDVVVANGMTKEIDTINPEDNILDIGPKTIELYNDYINKAATVFINGTAGKYEEIGFEKGTKEILTTAANAKGKVILGGGDAIASAEHFELDGFDFISTGGGATLDYIGSGKLKCLED